MKPITKGFLAALSTIASAQAAAKAWAGRCCNWPENLDRNALIVL